LGGLFVYPTGTLWSTSIPWDSEAKRKGSAEEKVGRMARESNTTAAHRCSNQETKNHRCEAFVPPRPRDRHRLKKGDSRAGYWCRRTAFLAKQVAVATREAREAKEMFQVAQEAHEQQFQQVQEQMMEMKQLLAAHMKQGVQQISVAQEQVADTQEFLVPLAPLAQQGSPAQALLLAQEQDVPVQALSDALACAGQRQAARRLRAACIGPGRVEATRRWQAAQEAAAQAAQEAAAQEAAMPRQARPRYGWDQNGNVRPYAHSKFYGLTASCDQYGCVLDAYGAPSYFR